MVQDGLSACLHPIQREGEMGTKVGIPTSYIPLAKLGHRVTDSYKGDWEM